MSDLTRRRLLGTAAAAGAVASVPGVSAQAAPRGRAVRRADVVVVGAGLSGLAAARELRRRGRSVLVLEARRRVGGRTLSAPIEGGEQVEVGGQWIGPTQDRIAALAKELGVGTFATYNSGENIYEREGLPRQRYTGAVPPDPTGLPDVAAALLKLNDMAAGVPRDAPWEAGLAEEYDSQTFETWKRDNTTTPSGRFLLDLGIEAVWACEPRDVSLLHVLFYIACAGNEGNPGDFNRLISVAGGAQESRFVGGSQRLSLQMARALGKRVVLNAAVRRIDNGARGVTVHTDRFTVKAKRVIVTGPPALGAQIRFERPLPFDRAQLLQRFPQGNAIKCMAVYDEPFWRGDGLTGQVTSDGDPVRLTFDNSPPDGSPGVLLGFIEGNAARRWAARPAPERRAAVLGQFAGFFGPRASSPKQYVEMDWAGEQWTRGCYVGFTPPGVLLDYGAALRRPVGRVHWAGAEYATIWNGYMEGAIRSGEEVARTVAGAG